MRVTFVQHARSQRLGRLSASPLPRTPGKAEYVSKCMTRALAGGTVSGYFQRDPRDCFEEGSRI